MKKVLVLLSLFISIPAFSQSADERIGTLINQSDWFGLEETYPVLKDSMQVEFLKLMSEIMIDYYFNRPDEAIDGIRKLLTNHQAEIGSGNALNMAILACQIEGEKGNYSVAAQQIQDIINQVKAQGAGKESYAGFESIFKFYNCLSGIPAPSIKRPEGDVTVPIDIEKVKLPTSIEPKGWRGTHILIPVTVHGKTYRFIFDTGAGTSFVSERFARELGVQILNDSLVINPDLAGSMYGKMGTLDSLQIGDMVFSYPLITVAPPNVLDSVMQVDALIGMDFISLFDELRIYPKEGKIVFPASTTPLPASGRNLLLTDRALKLKATANGEKLRFHFDTGCTTAGLHYPYYRQHKAQLDAVGKLEKSTGGGFNTVVTKEILRLPSFSLNIGGTPVVLQNLGVDVTTEGLQMVSDDGIIGMDMVDQFDCVTINMKDMFLKLE